MKITLLSEMTLPTDVCPFCAHEVDSFGNAIGGELEILTDGRNNMKICSECREANAEGRLLGAPTEGYVEVLCID